MPHTYNTQRMILYLLKDCNKLEKGLDGKNYLVLKKKFKSFKHSKPMIETTKRHLI